MKTRRKSLVVLTVVMALTLTAILVTASLAVAPPAWAKAEKTPFSGTIYYVTTIDEGEDRFADGNLIGRGIIMLYDDQMSDDRISGQETVVVNYNMRLVEDPVVMITGPMWGTSQIVNEDGYWDVVWTGKRDKRGWGYLRCVAHGHGEYEGLKAHFTGVRESPDPVGPFEYSGYILEPGVQ